MVYAIETKEKTPKLDRSAPISDSNHDLEQRLENKLIEVNSFNDSIKNNKEMITYFKDKNHKLKKKYKSYKRLTAIFESVHTVVNVGATTRSVTLSVTDVGLIVVPISVGSACVLSLGDDV